MPTRSSRSSSEGRPPRRSGRSCGKAALASAKLAEALDVSQRVYGVSINRAMEVIDPLLESAISLVPLDLTVARGAARIRAEYYHRPSRPISLADAVLIASATGEDCIATADPHVLAVANSAGIGSMALPGQD